MKIDIKKKYRTERFTSSLAVTDAAERRASITGELKPIEGYYYPYFADAEGNIYNGASWARLKGTINRHGYRVVNVKDADGKNRNVGAHRLVCAAFHGSPNGRHVNHINAVKSDNRPENLEWTDVRGNAVHAVNMDLMASGESSHFCTKLKKADVVEILSLRGILSQSKLAKRFNVRPEHIAAIYHRRVWRKFQEDMDRVREIID